MGLQLLALVNNSLLLCAFIPLIKFATLLPAGPDDGVDPRCSDLTVPDSLKGNILYHLGPYHGGLSHGIFIGTIFCTP